MNNVKHAHGKVAEDPVERIPIGGEITSTAILVSYDFPDKPASVKDWESLNGILLAITFSDREYHRIEGSAVIVAMGVAICAWHVIEHKIDNLVTAQEGIWCFGITVEGLQLWKVRKITHSPNTDIGILGLEPASIIHPNASFYRSVITTQLPQIGEQVTIFGFRASQNAFEITEAPLQHLSGEVLVCVGSVAQIFHKGRDSIMIRWPSLEITCPTWGGMSGGPVFNEKGMLIGLLSSSFASDSNDGPSYVSLVLPALSTKFEGGWPIFNSDSSLLDLDERACAIDGRNDIDYQ